MDDSLKVMWDLKSWCNEYFVDLEGCDGGLSTFVAPNVEGLEIMLDNICEIGNIHFMRLVWM